MNCGNCDKDSCGKSVYIQVLMVDKYEIFETASATILILTVEWVQVVPLYNDDF
jgi:hypothetical protein